MAENPFVRMYRDLAGRISRLPEVRLSRVDPAAPAEPADGWALSVGRQRVALGGGAVSLSKLAAGQLADAVRTSLRTQLAIPDPPVDVPDTGWLNLTPATGYTATNAQWRVRDGWAMMRGQITATEQWPTSAYAVCATIPMQARPASPTAATASDNGGRILGVALGSELSVINRLHSIAPTSTIRLDSIPCWRVD